MGKGVMYIAFMGAVQRKWCMRNGVVVNTMFNIMSLGKKQKQNSVAPEFIPGF